MIYRKYVLLSFLSVFSGVTCASQGASGQAIAIETLSKYKLELQSALQSGMKKGPVQAIASGLQY